MNANELIKNREVVTVKAGSSEVGLDQIILMSITEATET